MSSWARHPIAGAVAGDDVPGGWSPSAPRTSFWQDGYGRLMFICLFLLVSIAVDMGPLSGIAKSLRWVVLGVMCLPALRWLPGLSQEPFSAEHRWLLAFIVVGLLSCGWSIMPRYSFERWASFVLLWVAMFGGTWVWLRSRENVYRGVDILYALIVFVTVLSIVYTGREGFIDRTERATGAFDKATGTGGFAALAIPIILFKLKSATGKKRALALVMLLAQAYLLIFSGARAAILASMASLSVVVWSQFPRFRALMGTIGVLGVLVMLSGNVVLDILPDYVVRKESIETMTGRVERFRALLLVWQKKPLTGYGYGVGRYLIVRDAGALDLYLGDAPETRSTRFLRDAQSRGDAVVIHTHSDHIERLAETGVIGYVPFAAFLAALLLRIPRALQRPRGPLNDLVVLLLAASWPTILDTVTHSAMFAVGNGPMVMAWFLIIVTIAADTHAQEQQAAGSGL